MVYLASAQPATPFIEESPGVVRGTAFVGPGIRACRRASARRLFCTNPENLS